MISRPKNLYYTHSKLR